VPDTMPGRCPLSLLTRTDTVLACPACGQSLDAAAAPQLTCRGCGRRFASEDGIPLLFWPHDDHGDAGDVTETVKAFYEENPFPNYDDFDSVWVLRERARRSGLARVLDDELPRGALVLEVGCGTGQLSNFLGSGGDREVFGADLCLNSLRLASGFAKKQGITDVAFVQMNLFRPVFDEKTFDLVICNGVLHHTADPFGGFRSISNLVKDDGLILIGLYNRYGRVMTNVRRKVYAVTGDRFKKLDPTLRAGRQGERRRHTWFMDQYKHPHESQHTFDEVLKWFDRTGFEFVNSFPPIAAGRRSTDVRGILRPSDEGTRRRRLAVQMRMAAADREGGFYVMVGRRRAR
jgi:SAM-dependent methyltransferase